MGQKSSGFERFLAPSVSKIEEELGLIRAEINKMNEKIDETYNKVAKLEEGHKHLAARMDKSNDGLSTEYQVLINNINEMEKQDKDEIDALKRFMDVAQRRLTILEAKMKDLGQ
ncbi:MAG: hypothetical protein KGI25_08840 [Thaumarchaeota archaeon]|nr:hypothetical protein [Nitrososphaerota archaeon]